MTFYDTIKQWYFTKNNKIKNRQGHEDNAEFEMPVNKKFTQWQCT